MSTAEDERTSEVIANPMATSTPNQEVGAKRRKPQKTNKLTIKTDDNFEDVPLTPVSVGTCAGSDAEAEILDSVTLVEPEPASDEQDQPVQSGPLEIGVVEVGEDHTYKCPLCEEYLTSQKDFTVHIRAHNEVKPSPDPNDPTGQTKVYYCCLCGKMLSSFSSLDRHMLVHSGERPFSCQLCGQTFTTNGNMHRHKRTHSARDATLLLESTDDQPPRRGGGRKRHLPTSPAKGVKNTKSDLSSPARGSINMSRGRGGRARKLHKPNHNNVNDDEADDDDDDETMLQICNMPTLLHTLSNNSCFACSETFITESAMEAHIVSNHPNDKVRCNECNFLSPNFSYLKLHRNMFHVVSNANSNNNNNSIRSSNNPIVNNVASDVNVATQLTQSHQSSQLLPNSFLQLAAPALNQIRNVKSGTSFLSQSQSLSGDTGSILGSHLLGGSSRPSSNLTNGNSQAKNNQEDDKLEVQTSDFTPGGQGTSNDLDSQSDTSSVHRFDNNQSSDDSPTGKGDDPIIRDMKLRGEFPCRLCSAVYPNLRALKGHNKEHLAKAPYSCNVGSCAYSSNDKSTLTRHMRTHTGEKPFECKLCNYGFTTKANCERHLKNKHGKTSRDAIRHSIIIHDTEDGPAGNDNPCEDLYRCKVCKGMFSTSAKVITHAIKEHPAYASDVDHIFEEVKVKEKANDEDEDMDDDEEDDNNPSMVPRINKFPLLNDLRPHLQQSSSPAAIYQSDNSCGSYNNDHSGPDTPLDLSRPSKESPTSNPTAPKSEVSFANMPVLKLQGKIPVMPPHKLILDSNGLTKLTPATGCTPSAQAAMAAAVAAASGLLPGNFPFLFGGPGGGGSIPNTGNATFPFLLPQFVTPSALLPSIESLPMEIREKFQAEMKQRIQQLQLNSSMLGAPTLINNAVQAPPIVAASAKLSNVADIVSSQRDLLRKQAVELKEQTEAAEALQHLSQVQSGSIKIVHQESENGGGKSSSNHQSGRHSPADDDDTNYKMVIKNGVLMKKQKQRRYRTERPYSCNFCTARFTLRSNMERHIKQQHPENWCQKPRGSRRNHSATVPTLAPQFQHHLDGDDYDDEEEEGVLDREGSTIDDDNDEDGLVIVESNDDNEQDDDQDEENAADLVSVTKLVNSATSQSFQKYFENTEEENGMDGKEKDFPDTGSLMGCPLERKKSAYSAAPHKIPCPYCPRKFPWTSSLNRHILTHTGQKPYKCRECPLLFTTKSNCDRHVIRKHGGSTSGGINNNNDQSFTARNVPDRPYKCQMCPSSTFSSKSNLKKHQYTRHPEGTLELPAEGGGSSADDEDDDMDCDDDPLGNNHEIEEGVLKGQARFRCHVCQHPVQVFCDRKSALTHLKLKHTQDYEALVLRGDVTGCETLPDDKPNSESLKSISCLFCSNDYDTCEDLRSHMTIAHHKTPSTSPSPPPPPAPTSSQGGVKPSEPVQEKNEAQLKKKRASLMDKINQLSANASSVQTSLFKQKEAEQILVE